MRRQREEKGAVVSSIVFRRAVFIFIR
jgi:hypothetical protein